MTLTNRIAEALKNRASAEMTLYWDTQDASNVGPAYRTENDSGALELTGWAHVSGRKVEDAEVVGYNVRDYFSGPDGAYAGPDQDGIYPVLSDGSVGGVVWGTNTLVPRISSGQIALDATCRQWRCTDGHVAKTIQAASAQAAADAYALVTSDVTVTEVDENGREIGTATTIRVTIQ